MLLQSCGEPFDHDGQLTPGMSTAAFLQCLLQNDHQMKYVLHLPAY